MNAKMKKISHIASFACLVHCLATPILVMFLPLLGAFFHNIWVEIALLTMSIFFGVFIIYQGYCSHKKFHAWVTFVVGISFWSVHVALEYYHIHYAEGILLASGTFFVMLAYFVNHRHLGCHDDNTSCCAHTDCEDAQ